MHIHDSNLRQLVLDGIHAGSMIRAGCCQAGVDRRQALRYQTRQKAYMHSVYPVPSNRRVVTVLDLSRNGLCVEAALPESEGASVRVQIKDAFVIGEVRHCREVGELYHIGIRADAVLYDMRRREGGILEMPVVR